jgi:YgiT-type zinc finger domain-containing protein
MQNIRFTKHTLERVFSRGISLCKANMTKGTTDLTFRRGRSVVIIEGVPALVCQQCEEASIDSSVAQKAYDLAEMEIKRGVTLEFLKFKAA